MYVIWRCECSAERFVQCSDLNTEICMECKGLRSSSHPNTFEGMKLTPYLFKKWTYNNKKLDLQQAFNSGPKIFLVLKPGPMDDTLTRPVSKQGHPVFKLV